MTKLERLAEDYISDYSENEIFSKAELRRAFKKGYKLAIQQYKSHITLNITQLFMELEDEITKTGEEK